MIEKATKRIYTVILEERDCPTASPGKTAEVADSVTLARGTGDVPWMFPTGRAILKEPGEEKKKKEKEKNLEPVAFGHLIYRGNLALFSQPRTLFLLNGGRNM